MLNTPRAIRGIVTSPHHMASQAALDVLKDGGNAVEAAVAAAAALSVLYPHMTGIGGDAFWLIAEPGREPVAIQGCGRAGAGVGLALYQGHSEIPVIGPLAANTVAGAVSSWEAALGLSGGRLTRPRLLRDAIQYAREGAPVSDNLAETLRAKAHLLQGSPGLATIFAPEGEALKAGALLKLPRFARTLEQLAENGFDSFYRGALADDIAADLAALGAPISRRDLETHEAWRAPALSVKTSKAQLFNAPPPTQGLASLLILALFDRIAPENADGFDYIHRLVETAKQAFAIRDSALGDPAYMDFDPQALLSDAVTLDRLAQDIDLKRASTWPRAGEPSDTTWFGVIDGEGRAVSVIQSLYHEFGSSLVLPKTGIIWQNRGASFRLAATGWNALKPGRMPFHTLNPALARFDDGRVLAYGSMGGDGQPQFQSAVFTRYAYYGQDLQAAVTAPRWLLGRTWGEQSVALRLEQRFGAALGDELKAAGHPVEYAPDLSSMMGHAGAVLRRADGVFEAAADPRSDGAVACW